MGVDAGGDAFVKQQEQHGFEHLRVIDLRLVQDRNDRWRLFVEGVEHDFSHPNGLRFSLAEHLADLIRRPSTPFPERLWSAIWKRAPWGHP